MEQEEALGFDIYEMNWSQYDSALGRFSTIDIMTEQRDWITPYNFVQNNPISRIDPTGLLDDYGLDQHGNVELIKPTDSLTDTLYSVTRNKDGNLASDNNGEIIRNDTNGDGNVDNSDSISVSKEKDGTSVLSDLSVKNEKGQRIVIGGQNKQDDIFVVFKFAPDNSNVEWSAIRGKKRSGIIWGCNLTNYE